VKTNDIPAGACLDCGEALDAATSVGDSDSTPSSGDVTICIKCGHIMAFDDLLRLRELTGEEIVDMAGDPRIIAIQKARVEIEKEKKA